MINKNKDSQLNANMKLKNQCQYGPGAIVLSRADMTLAEVQCHLDKVGASNLIVEIFMKNPNQLIFFECVELGIALLEGGNNVIQNSIYQKLMIGNCAEKFFKVFYDKIKFAQQEVKAIIPVNPNEKEKSAYEKNDSSLAGVMNKRENMRGNRNHNGIILSYTEELKKQIDDAANATSKAYQHINSVGYPSTPLPNQISINEPFDRDSGSQGYIPLEDVYLVLGSDRKHSKSTEETRLPLEIAIMQQILRFLQLLCENHNLQLQNYLRYQNNKHNYNMVSETLMFLDHICGSTTGGLGLLGLYINENNVSLVNQTLETLTEYCQGPCHENQNCIAMHESNGIDIIIALILNDINPLGRKRMDLVLELKNNASKLLLAIMESRADNENAERILYNMSPKQLIDVACNAFHQSEEVGEEIDIFLDGEDNDEEVNPKEVGHNIYILCHQLAQHNKELASLLKCQNEGGYVEMNDKMKKALTYYQSHTTQIEVICKLSFNIN